MPGQVLIAGYQIGYRICNIEHDQFCDCAYTDLPMHRVEDYRGVDSIQCASFAMDAAQTLLDKMRADFFHREMYVEWRIVECWE
jgi:hypothetical protein